MFFGPVRKEEVERIEQLVWKRIGENVQTFAYCTDRNGAPLHNYARLGAAKAPTDIRSDSLEECVSQFGGDGRPCSVSTQRMALVPISDTKATSEVQNRRSALRSARSNAQCD